MIDELRQEFDTAVLFVTHDLGVAAERANQLVVLREQGLGELELLDLVQATAFFAWVNRLMLTLGEPYDD